MKHTSAGCHLAARLLLAGVDELKDVQHKVIGELKVCQLRVQLRGKRVGLRTGCKRGLKKRGLRM
jgi:hypothetical protein